MLPGTVREVNADAAATPVSSVLSAPFSIEIGMVFWWTLDAAHILLAIYRIYRLEINTV